MSYRRTRLHGVAPRIHPWAQLLLLGWIAPWMGRAATEVGGILTTSTVWTLAQAPYLVTNDVTVAANAVLIIEPGVEVRFHQDQGLTVEGRLLAEGTPTQRIRFTRNEAAGASRWSRIDFAPSPHESRILHADIEYAAGPDTIRGRQTSLHLEGIVWTHTTAQLLKLTDCSLLLRHCRLPSIENSELVHIRGIPPNGHMVIQGNLFGTTTGYNDILDITGGNRPGPILQLLDNVFLGAVDDCLDLDGTDAHIEGNLFLHVHQDAVRPSTANAISTGADGTNTSELMIVRNIFYDCDHALLLKDGASAVLQNNTIVRIRTNPPAAAPAAVINFYEPRPDVTPGAAALLEGNIIWDVAEQRLFLHFTNSFTRLLVRTNLLPTLDFPGGPGLGNIVTNPGFVDLAETMDRLNLRNHLALRADSPARRAGPNGIDLGALVPPGATVSGEPSSPTTQNWAILRVAGPGIVAYRWQLNDGPWSEVMPLTNSLRYDPTLFDDAVPIVLSNLSPGTYTVRVLGLNSAGVWQDTNQPTVSKSWTVLPAPLAWGGFLTSNTTWNASRPVHLTQTVTVPTNLTLTIEPGTEVRLGSNVALRAQAGGRIQILGTPEQPVQFLPLEAADWSELGAAGTNAELFIRHARIAGGATTVSDGARGFFEFVTFCDFPSRNIEAPILLTERAATVYVRACHFTNYYETLFRYGLVTVEDCLFENIRGDGVDLDAAAPGSVIRRCTLRHGAASNVDAIDVGSDSAGVQVEACWIHDFPFDKGISIGETSTNIGVSHCVIFDVDTGIAVKDGSEALIVHNTISRTRRALHLYQKTAGQGGGRARAWNNIFWGNESSVTLDSLSLLSLQYSDVDGPNLYPGEGNLNLDPRFRDPQSADFRLQPGSPAIGSGTNGSTLGALGLIGSFLVDSDNDDLPDPWELLQNLDPRNPADAHSDHDGDGFPAVAEFLAGTDPWNAADRPTLAITARSGQILLKFAAVPDRLYTLDARSLNAANSPGAWQPLKILLTTNHPTTFAVPLPLDSPEGRMFRLQVKRGW